MFETWLVSIARFSSLIKTRQRIPLKAKLLIISITKLHLTIYMRLDNMNQRHDMLSTFIVARYSCVINIRGRLEM